jgi:diadenosine tetraphosphatase ApaH/serine/threonine PP2A family protein phosphatase
LACIGSNTVNIAEFNNDARVANIWNGRQLKTTYKQFLNQLPLARSMDEQFYVVHGSPKDPVWEYLLRPYQAEDNWQVIPHQTCFIGHSHVQIYIRRNIDGSISGPIMPTPGEVMLLDGDERYFINPGSVGQPRDGDPRAAYAILDTSAQQITFGRVTYDIASTQQQMLEHNLPLMLVRRLQFGR